MGEGPGPDRTAAGRWRGKAAGLARRGRDRSGSVATDSMAGLTVTVSSVPNAMANGLLAGVNPIYGLYANMIGPVVGGLLSSTALMVISSTSAAALVAGQALPDLSFAERADAMVVMVVLAGLIQILFGALKLESLTRFVSYSVTTGFIAGIATLLLLSQLATITGTAPEASNRVAETVELLTNLGEVHPTALGLAVLTFVIAVGLQRTRLSKIAGLLAIVIPATLVAVLGLDDVDLVRDVGEIGGGVPLPALPSPSALSPDVVTGACAVAAIVIVQSAGVAQNLTDAAQPKGASSRDFVAQGGANVASALFKGLPVGGSLAGTALNLGGGARRRWAAISSGLWMLAIVVAVPALIGRVAMPALGALLILAGLRIVRPTDVAAVWRAGWPSQLAAGTTFVATLVLPIQAAVGIGVVLAALLHVSGSSTDISVVELVERPDGRVEERRPPDELPGDAVVVLDVYGSLFYAGARTLERRLPPVGDAARPVVLLRLRGRTTLGATLVDVLSTYAGALDGADGRLYLTGLSERARDHLVRTGAFHSQESTRVYAATPTLGESTRRAYGDAQAWLVSNDPAQD